ncbi:tachylectin-related carbohydrate-binding protein [Actinoplanes sp. NPDC089786]|uniref:tachylectin-related carbohydrate-binding protein n=1 Tax=Actinoplanes sp. NPDC089786 TaxID=3155185 RepID=UPI003418C6AB
MMRTTRRRLGGAVLAAAAVVPVGVAVAVSPAQAADTFQCAPQTTLFGVAADGKLYKHVYNKPGTDQAQGTTSINIGIGWNGFNRVLGGPDGRIYGINSSGAFRYRYTGTAWEIVDGSESVAMGTNLADYANPANRNKITVDEIGDFYGVDGAGKLRQWRFDEATKTWPINGRVIDTGWNRYNLIVAAGPGVLFGREPDGDLFRSRYESTSQRWVGLRNRLVGDGWGIFPQDVFSVGGDVLLGRKTNGDLNHYRFREDTLSWPIGGTRIGTGWNFTTVIATTSSCSLTDRHVPPLTSVPIQRSAPLSVVQGQASGTALGPIEYLYNDNIGRLRHAYQPNPDSFTTVQFSTVSSGAALTGRTALLPNGQSVLQALALSTTGEVWSFTRAAAPSTSWQAGQSLGGRMASRPAAVRLSDGSLLALAVDVDGHLWLRPQDGSSGDLLAWRDGDISGLDPEVTAVAGADRTATVFSRRTGAGVELSRYVDGRLQAPSTVFAAVDATPAVVVMPGQALRVFGRTRTGEIVTRQTDADGRFTTPESAVGSGFTAVGTPVAVLDPSGRVAVVARGEDNEIYRIFETEAGSDTWGTWERLNPDVSDPSVTDPTLAEYTGSAGQSWMVAFRNQNEVTRVYTRQVPTGAARSTGSVPRLVGHSLPKPRR